MTKTKTLLILGIVLTLVIIGLIIYAYQTTLLTTAPTNTTPPKNTKEKLITEEQSSKATEIKEQMKTVEQKALEEIECDDETAQEYQEKAETNKVVTAQGILSAINSDSLTVNFNQGSIKWQATVRINPDTLIAIPASISKPQLKEISLADLKQNDNLVVNIAEDETIINNQDFTAGSIFKLE